MRTSSGISSARLAWKEGERGRMVPRLVVGEREVGPSAVEVLEADGERAEALRAAGYAVSSDK